MRAERLLSILLLLQTRGRMTAGQLAGHLQVSERTIYRDLDALSLAGIPIYSEHGPGGGYALVDSYRTDLTGMTETEIRTLVMSGVYAPLADLGLADALEAALLKLSAALPESRRLDLERIRQRIHLDTIAWFNPGESVPHLQVLQEACWNNRRVHMTYVTWDGQFNERVIEPLGLVAKVSVWYVVARRDDAMRVYRVGRIQSAYLLDDTFERPPDFKLADYWEGWCDGFINSLPQYPVQLRVSPQVLPHLERGWRDLFDHLERVGKRKADGWIQTEYTFESIHDATGMIIQFGHMIEVLEPDELREAIVSRAQGIVRLYRR